MGGKLTTVNCNDAENLDESLHCVVDTETNKPIVVASGVVVIVLSVIRLLIESVQIGLQRSKYFGFNNFIELALFSLSIYFCTNIFQPNQVPNSIQWQIGVVCVFLSWMNLMMFLRKVSDNCIMVTMVTIMPHGNHGNNEAKFSYQAKTETNRVPQLATNSTLSLQIPKYGVYIVMFIRVLRTFLQIMVILFIFIIAFALSFNMVLDDVSLI